MVRRCLLLLYYNCRLSTVILLHLLLCCLKFSPMSSPRETCLPPPPSQLPPVQPNKQTTPQKTTTPENVGKRKESGKKKKKPFGLLSRFYLFNAATSWLPVHILLTMDGEPCLLPYVCVCVCLIAAGGPVGVVCIYRRREVVYEKQSAKQRETGKSKKGQPMRQGKQQKRVWTGRSCMYVYV